MLVVTYPWMSSLVVTDLMISYLKVGSSGLLASTMVPFSVTFLMLTMMLDESAYSVPIMPASVLSLCATKRAFVTASPISTLLIVTL